MLKSNNLDYILLWTLFLLEPIPAMFFTSATAHALPRISPDYLYYLTCYTTKYNTPALSL